MIFRFTNKAAEKINLRLSDSLNLAENRYCEWITDILADGENSTYFLITNAYSLFSIVISANTLTDWNAFSDCVRHELKDYFYTSGHADLFEQYIAQNLDTIEVSKTNNRSVASSMNGLKEHLFYYLKDFENLEEQNNRFSLNDKINDYPCKCANTGVGDYTFAEQFIVSDFMKQPIPDKSELQQKAKLKKPAFTFYAELYGITPKIWRRFIISENATMEDLAFALMAQFNMDGSHLYLFKNTEKNIEVVSDLDEEMDAADNDFIIHKLHQIPPERYEAYRTRIKTIINSNIEELEFIYDFGDNWLFKIVRENEIRSELLTGTQPYILAGEGLGIIENCGGIGGLEDLKKAFNKKHGEEYQSYREWLGVDSIDFDNFDIVSVNKSMKKKIKGYKDIWYE